MICLIALVAFSILGIFSASHRKIALQAFDCVFRRITLRECQSGLDRKLRNSIIGTISRKNVRLANFVYRNFEIISWIFTVLMILSIIFTARGIYYYAVYGNCNGQGSSAFCAFNGFDKNNVSGNSTDIPCNDSLATLIPTGS